MQKRKLKEAGFNFDDLARNMKFNKQQPKPNPPGSEAQQAPKPNHEDDDLEEKTEL